MIHLFCCFGVWVGIASGQDAAFRERLDRAAALARSSQFEEALPLLEALAEESDYAEAVVHDLTAALSWAGEDRRATALAPRISPDRAPLYVLEALAKSFRNIREFEQARRLYLQILDRAPNRIDAHAGLALVDVDLSCLDEAIAHLHGVEPIDPMNPSLVSALAFCYSRKGDLFQEMVYWRRLTEIEPENQAAARALALAVSDLGAPHLAMDILDRRNGADMPEHGLEKIEGDRAARWINWGEMTQPSARQRFDETDIALELLAENLARTEPQGDRRLRESRRARFDQLTALRDRVMMTEAVALFETVFEADPDRLPNYAIIAVADAYLYLERPKMARDLYRFVLARNPQNVNAAQSLYYAYLESEAHQRALTTVRATAAEQPVWLRDPVTGLWEENWNKVGADTTAAMAEAYIGRLRRAQERLEAMRAVAPHNAALRQLLANIYLWRGWPEKALHHYDLALAVDPRNLGARVWRVHALIDLAAYDAIPPRVASLVRAFPESAAVRKLARDWNTRRGFHLQSDVVYSDGPGGNLGTDELAWESYLAGPLMSDWHRFYAHHYYARADFIDGSVHFRRIGAGWRFEKRALSLFAEAHARDLDYEDPGLTVGGAWRQNDYWRFSASYNSYDHQVPLKGRLADLEGEALALGVQWRLSDRSAHRASFTLQDFNDGNLRRSLFIGGSQQLHVGPRYRLALEGSLYGSRNSERDRIYFNPEEDFSYGLAADQSWLHYRRYDFKMRHRLVVEAGQYWQKGFGTDWTGVARYEHQWDFSDRFGFLYGVSRSRRVFDGVPEYATGFYATLNWRF